jgi:exonuclease SbcD
MIIPQITLERENREETNNQVNLNQDIKGLFTDYFKQKYAGQLPNEDILNLFDEVLNGNNLK